MVRNWRQLGATCYPLLNKIQNNTHKANEISCALLPSLSSAVGLQTKVTRRQTRPLIKCALNVFKGESFSAVVYPQKTGRIRDKPSRSLIFSHKAKI
jgi:hypothetical protein